FFVENLYRLPSLSIPSLSILLFVDPSFVDHRRQRGNRQRRATKTCDKDCRRRRVKRCRSQSRPLIGEIVLLTRLIMGISKSCSEAAHVWASFWRILAPARNGTEESKRSATNVSLEKKSKSRDCRWPSRRAMPVPPYKTKLRGTWRSSGQKRIWGPGRIS